ncbi:MAG: flavin reductase family protein [Conexibacter sp.]
MTLRRRLVVHPRMHEAGARTRATNSANVPAPAETILFSIVLHGGNQRGRRRGLYASPMADELDPARYRAVFGHFATGVAVITCAGASGTGGLTANAVCSVSLDPLLALVCFEQSARTLPLVREAGRFAVNVLRAGSEDVARVFASKVPEREKLSGVPHRLEAGMPILDCALAWIVCDVDQLVPAGDHEIAIGRVVAMDLTEGDPLLWYRGAYRGLGGQSA